MAIKYTPTPLPEQQRLRFNVGAFCGINKLGKANSGEFVDCKNMSSDKYPYASPRPSREVIAEGITNPQKLLFCGDKLSYIAEGKLNVLKGEGFASIGDVGDVTSAVDFNNTHMLFYPSDFVYDYEELSLSKPIALLPLKKGYYNNSNVFDSSSSGGWVKYFADRNRAQIRAATFAICPNEGTAGLIEAGAVTDANGNIVKDDDGNTIYNTITINVEGNSEDFCPDSAKAGKCCMRLFVHAFDENDEPLYKIYEDEPEYVVFSKFKFGEPILFNGVAPKSMYIQVGYYFPDSYRTLGYEYVDETDGEATDKCYEQVDIDLTNPNFKIWASRTSYPGPNSIPYIKYACMDNNRVVAVEGNNFYASSLGDYANWTDFVDADGNPKETGAYAEELYTYGDFTGIIKYNNNVVLTKADLTYICYGNKPPYRINEICKSGCISGDTLAEVGGYLYWLGREGVYRFGGGIPQVISSKIGSGFTDGVACGNGHKYYICLGNGTDYRLYVYDTRYGLWHIEDERRYISLTAKEGSVYGLTADGEILKFNSGDERVEWEFTTTDYDFGTEYTKNIAKVYCRLKLYGQSYVDVYIRTNKHPWYKFANFKAEGISVFQAKAKLKKFDYFTLRFVGRGEAEIMDIYADIFVGSQKHRSGDNLTVFK